MVLCGLSPEELQTQADAFGWFHTIDLGRGVVTKGLTKHSYTPDQLPPVAGRSVLDIGAWDGRYSFMAESQGASRVVALDHYAWGVDIPRREEYWRQCTEAGVLPDLDRDTTDFWQPDLPGRRGFDFAHEALGSEVEPVLADFADMDLDELGEFDVVFYLGVLYHMPEPLTALKRVRQVTKLVAAVETEALHIPTHDSARLMEFHGGNQLGNDFGNWYVPTLEALRELCFAAGFGRVEVLIGTPKEGPDPSAPLRARAGYRVRRVFQQPEPVHYRALVHAFT